MKLDEVKTKIARFWTTNMMADVNCIYFWPSILKFLGTTKNPRTEFFQIKWCVVNDSLIFLRAYDRVRCRKRSAKSFFQLMQGIIEFEVDVHTCSGWDRRRWLRVSRTCLKIATAPTACMEAKWMVCTSWINLELSNQVHLHKLKNGNWKSC